MIGEFRIQVEQIGNSGRVAIRVMPNGNFPIEAYLSRIITSPLEDAASVAAVANFVHAELLSLVPRIRSERP